MTEDDGEIDLNYDERYSRARRNSLAVSSLLVLFSLARFDGAVPLPMINAPGNIPQKMVILLLMCANLFFFIGYWRFYRRTIDRNLAYVVNTKDGDPSTAIDNFIDDIEGFKNELVRIMAYSQPLTKALNNFEQRFRNNSQDSLKSSTSILIHPNIRNQLFTGTDKENADKAIGLAIEAATALHKSQSEIEYLRKNMKIPLNDFNAVKEPIESKLDSISTNISEMYQKMLRISGRVRNEDLFWFRYFDHYSTSALFLASMVFALYTFSNLKWEDRPQIRYVLETSHSLPSLPS